MLTVYLVFLCQILMSGPRKWMKKRKSFQSEKNAWKLVFVSVFTAHVGKTCLYGDTETRVWVKKMTSKHWVLLLSLKLYTTNTVFILHLCPAGRLPQKLALVMWCNLTMIMCRCCYHIQLRRHILATFSLSVTHQFCAAESAFDTLFCFLSSPQNT